MIENKLEKENTTKTIEKNWEEILKSQQKKYSNLEIPQVIIYLAEKIIQLGGRKTKGIFRLSIRNDLKLKYIEQFKNDGFINLKDEKDCNVPAVLLKHFFAYSTLPLFENYEDCLNASNESDFQKLLDKLTQVNQKILFFLCSFIIEMSSYSQDTLMDISNLCLIFSPGFLRDDSFDMQTWMIQQPKEQKFMMDFFKWIAPKITNKFEYLKPTDEEREKIIQEYEKEN